MTKPPVHPPVSSLPEIPPEQSFIDYPCAFPIKVMGVHNNDFIESVVTIARSHDPAFDPDAHLEKRPSSSGTYVGLTVTVTATSREQLDNIYRALTGHPLVKYVL